MLGIYGPPKVPLRLSVTPERLIDKKSVEGGQKRPGFGTLRLALGRAELLVSGAESV